MSTQVSWQDALKRLQEGNSHFVADKLDGKLQDSARRDSLTGGQNPYAIILSCADSRVVPELAFDTGLGEIFVIRVAGNIANTSSIASIEYAVTQLGTKLIVVLGHESCGAVQAAMQNARLTDAVSHLVDHIVPAIDASGDGADVATVVCKNAQVAASDLTSKSAAIKNAVDNEGVKIVSAYYNLGSGKVDFLED